MGKQHFLDKPKIGFVNVCVVDGKAWFAADAFNGLGYIDLRSGQMEYAAGIPGEDACARLLYIDIVYYKGCLVLVPFSARAIAIYDMKKGEFKKIELKEPSADKRGRYGTESKFRTAMVEGNRIYFLPVRYPAVVELDMSTGEVHYYDEWVEKFQSLDKVGNGFAARNPVIYGDIIFMGTAYENVCMSFDMRSKKTSLLIKENIVSCCCMIKVDGKLLVSARPDGRMILYPSPEMEDERMIRYPYTAPENIAIPVWGMNTVKKDIVFIWNCDGAITRMDMAKSEFKLIRKGDGNGTDLEGCMWEDRQHIFYYDRKCGVIESYDAEGFLIKRINAAISDEFWWKWEDSLLQQQTPYKEEWYLTLADYFRIIGSVGKSKKENMDKTQTIGSRLFDIVMKDRI